MASPETHAGALRALDIHLVVLVENPLEFVLRNPHARILDGEDQGVRVGALRDAHEPGLGVLERIADEILQQLDK